MPRPKTVYPGFIVGLRREETDIFHDYEAICTYLLNTYEDLLTDGFREELRDRISNCRKEKVELVHRNRVYITTDGNLVSLMMVDVDEHVLEHMKYVFDLIGPDPHEAWEYGPPVHADLWIFEGDEMTYHAVVRPRILCELVIAFSKENLVDYNVSRYEWKTKPRPRKLRSKDKLPRPSIGR